MVLCFSSNDACLPTLVLSLFIVVLGFAHHSIWSCVAHALVALLRVYYRAACFRLLNSWSPGLMVLESSLARPFVLQSCMPILKTNPSDPDWYTISVLIPDVEIVVTFTLNRCLTLNLLSNVSSPLSDSDDSLTIIITNLSFHPPQQ